MDFVGGFKKTRKYLSELLELLFPQRSFVQLGLKLHLSYRHLHVVNISLKHFDVCHTTCICLALHHCVISNVSLNCLRERM